MGCRRTALVQLLILEWLHTQLVQVCYFWTANVNTDITKALSQTQNTWSVFLRGSNKKLCNFLANLKLDHLRIIIYAYLLKLKRLVLIYTHFETLWQIRHHYWIIVFIVPGLTSALCIDRATHFLIKLPMLLYANSF